jgi:thymidylate kinase
MILAIGILLKNHVANAGLRKWGQLTLSGVQNINLIEGKMILINFEGLDGTGKSTLVKAVSAALGVPNITTKEPGSPHIPVNTQIRELVLNDRSLTPLARELLFYADAKMHKDFLNSKTDIFLSDRGLWSHKAYLRGYLKTQQIDYDDYDSCKRMISLCCQEPDAIIYLRGSLDLMKERSKDKQLDAIETNNSSFYRAVLDTYEDLCVAAEWNGDRLLMLNAEDSVDNNVKAVITFIHENFRPNQFETKDPSLSRV